MQRVTQRERFLDTLTGEGSDRFPFFDLDPSEDTLERWRKEGFPRWRSFSKYFNLETHHSVGLMLRSHPFYRKAPDLLYNPSSFERHYHPDQRSRYARGFVKRGRLLRQKGRILSVDAWGGGLLQMLGAGDWESLANACVALVEKPQAVEALIQRTTDFYCICLERVLSKVPADYATFYEPIASNKGPVISPAMFERFAVPGYRQVIGLLQKFDVPLRILCSTGGNLASLLPSLIDAGINGLWISNIRSAEMEYPRLRHRFGSQLALIGGIDATALAGDEASTRRVIEETVPVLLQSGHYLPCLDDRPRSNIPFSNFILYRRILEETADRYSPQRRRAR